MTTENFNRLLKYLYLKGKKVKRLDKILCALLNLLRDKLFDLVIKYYKGKVVKKLQILRKRHKDSYSLSEERVVQEPDKFFVLGSKCTDLYTVKKITECRHCLLRCDHCKSCVHEFTCSCLDIRSNMCKHIHLVARKFFSSEPTNEDNPMDDSPSLRIEEEEESVLDQQIISKELNCQENLSCKPFETSLQNYKTELLKTIDENVQNLKQLLFLKKYLSGFLLSLKAMKLTSSTSNQVDNAPTNTNNMKQIRFVSTKKNKKKGKKPSR